MNITAAITAPAAEMRWSAAQAGYQPGFIGDPAGRAYASTRHGIVARTFMGRDMAEIALLRRGNRRGTFQGIVRAIDGGWEACVEVATADGGSRWHRIGEVCGDYLDAEAQLLRIRTGVRAAAAYNWPSLWR